MPPAWFTLNDVDKQMLLETRIFHTSGCTFVYDTTRAVTQYAMQVVKEAGGMISFDLNWRPFLFDKKFAEEFIIPYLCKIDILKHLWKCMVFLKMRVERR